MAPVASTTWSLSSLPVGGCSCSSSSSSTSRTTQGTRGNFFSNHTSFQLYDSSYKSRHLVLAKAVADDQNPKRRSVICTNCDGNSAVLCSQCKGSGVNSVDAFGGKFKAGDSCWLCGGKKDMLCGECNGAGFIGGFMSTFDE